MHGKEILLRKWKSKTNSRNLWYEFQPQKSLFWFFTEILKIATPRHALLFIYYYHLFSRKIITVLYRFFSWNSINLQIWKNGFITTVFTRIFSLLKYATPMPNYNWRHTRAAEVKFLSGTTIKNCRYLLI